MKTEEIINKETKQVLVTKEGTPLIKNTLETGDKFVCVWNAPVQEQKGESKHPRHYVKMNILSHGVESTEFVELTPTQYETLKAVAEDINQDDLNQYVFTCYEYTNSLGTKSVGVTHKVKKPAVKLQ